MENYCYGYGVRRPNKPTIQTVINIANLITNQTFINSHTTFEQVWIKMSIPYTAKV